VSLFICFFVIFVFFCVFFLFVLCLLCGLFFFMCVVFSWYALCARRSIGPTPPARARTLGTTPILAKTAAFTAAKSGRVIAWNREDDAAALEPRSPPGSGPRAMGAASPMAYADDRLFRTGGEPLQRPRSVHRPRRRVRRTLWERHLPSADVRCATVSNNVVFTASGDGVTYGSPHAMGGFSGTRGCARTSVHVRRSSATRC